MQLYYTISELKCLFYAEISFLISMWFVFADSLYKLKLRTSKITVHLENSIENATKVSHQAAFSLAFKASGIASRNLSTKSDISCSEIVKNSLA